MPAASVLQFQKRARLDIRQSACYGISTATHCNTLLQHTAATHCHSISKVRTPHSFSTHTNLQHTTTHCCNTLLQRTAATHCHSISKVRTPHSFSTHKNLQQPATHCCITLLHHTAATHCCNTLPISFSSRNYIELLDVEWQCVAAMCCSVLQ